MGVLTDKPENIGLDSKNRAERDRIDLNHEMAGLETGRQKRFLPESAAGLYGETEKQKSERRYRTLLEMLLAEDPQYAALYTRVSEKLEKAQQAVDRALIDINQRLEASVEKLQILRGSAAELEDGTKVFQSLENNSIYTEDGKRLSDKEAQNITFSADAPSWEEYKAEKEKHDLAVRQKDEVETYQHDVLDPAEERMKDDDSPPSMDELEEIERVIEDKIPEPALDNYRIDVTENTSDLSSSSAVHDLVEETKLDVPEMGEAFDLARVDIPDLGPAPESDPAPARTLG